MLATFFDRFADWTGLELINMALNIKGDGNNSLTALAGITATNPKFPLSSRTILMILASTNRIFLFNE
jgi:hypothetical protein